MINSKDWIELEKYAETLMKTEKNIGAAIEKNVTADEWDAVLADAVKARHDFYSKLYEMRFNYNCC